MSPWEISGPRESPLLKPTIIWTRDLSTLCTSNARNPFRISASAIPILFFGTTVLTSPAGQADMRTSVRLCRIDAFIHTQSICFAIPTRSNAS